MIETIEEETTKTITAELEEISRQNDGLVKPENVVAFAENPETALHARFDWDDSVAGRKWRLQQARNILHVYVKMEMPDRSEPLRVRAYFSLPSDRGTNGYRNVKDVLKTESWRQELLEMAKKEAKAFMAKYIVLKELAEVNRAMDKFING